ncbi:MAG: ABC transporter ATP-binding protein [Chloroflexi bacterium]|nr:ABC transporter ATP-binding protein [Chloroflexota bacterium]
MSSITIQNLTKHYGRTVALSDMTLSIEDREFLVMVGPTGAGKTTTLRCIAGLTKPDKGAVLYDGEDMTDISPAVRDVAFVFQNYALYPRKTVFENIAFPLRARKYTASQREQAIMDVARMLRIDHLMDRRPAQLSGGEQQRVALGRAMVRRPRAFLMDEPLTNLDFQLRAEMRMELKRIQQELNRTFFYVTNDQVEAMAMGDRVAVLNQGVLQQVGPPQEVYEKPANLFVAGFIGSVRMNFLECAYNTDHGTLVSTNNHWSLKVPEHLRAAAQSAHDIGQLTLGIRPEDLRLSPQNGPGDLEGAVYVVEPLGDRNVYDIQVGSKLVKAKTPATFLLDAGAPVSLLLNMDRTHLFDAVTGMALT